MKQFLGLIALVVRDYDEAIAYYVGTLGFELVEDTYVPEQDKRWVVVAPPGAPETRLLLARAANAEQAASVGNQTGGRVFLFLYTDDFARDYEKYKARGVVFVREKKLEPYGTVAVFKDLYGNLWDLLEPRADPAASGSAIASGIEDHQHGSFRASCGTDQGHAARCAARERRTTHMATPEIRFDDGAAYERYMGLWSRLVGETFIDWLAAPTSLRWLDVGCGSGAFTELIIERCRPARVHGIDPSQAQLDFARARRVLRSAQFLEGDAMALPFPDDSFDAAVMPLVIFFVPDPPRGVAEMVRVVRPGGFVAAYAWDMPGGGFPYSALQTEMRELGMQVPLPPSAQVSSADTMRDLWLRAGLEAVETREITVQRSFTDFADYWATIRGGPSVGARLSTVSRETIAELEKRMRARLAADASGRITYSARANAVKGRVRT